jgi:outer membrane protein TolC
LRAAGEARLAEARQKVQAEEAQARTLHASAIAYREVAPQQVIAARETELRLRKRYEAELSTVTEVAEAIQLVARAEVNAALATLSLWRARLAECRARGDLGPLLAPLPPGGVQ